jgi:intein-encoded DNA endonuclease-like protein
MKKLNEEQIKEVCELYKKGNSSIKLADMFGVSKRTILILLRENNIERKTMRELFLEKKDEIVRLHKEGYTVDQICKMCNTKHETVKPLLKELGYETASRKKYFYNESVFEKIDTEEKAYWLGFIYADGMITDSKGYLSRLSFGIKDEEHLIKFVEFINGSEEMVRSRDSYYILDVNSKKICTDLYRLGVVPRKSLVIEFPKEDIVPKHLLRHFLRGYFDGDGSIVARRRHYKNKEKKYLVVVSSFVGTKMFIEKMQEHFKEELELDKNKAHNINGVTVEYKKQGVQAMKLLQYMYSDSNIHLDRKYNKFTALLEGNF